MKSPNRPLKPDFKFDVIVIGGGVLGLSIARDCAMRRLSVILFEQGDFGSGSTDASSGILSGEPHWLDQDPAATRAACQEINVLQRIAPNLLSRIPTLYPALTSEARFQLDYLEAFARAYTPISESKGGKPSVRLSRNEALQIEPGLSPLIRGAVSTDEWGASPHRLAILLAKSAAAAGATLLTRTRVTHVDAYDRRATGVKVKSDGATESTVLGRIVVNAAGSGATAVDPNRTANLPSRLFRTAYLALERRIVNVGIACPAANSQKRVFLFPRDTIALIGPSETEINSAAQPRRDLGDIHYLIDTVQRYFPRISEYRFTSLHSGLRSSVALRFGEKLAPGINYVIREHTEEAAENFFSIVGGSHTTARKTAEAMTDIICRRLKKRERCRTHLESLPGCTSEIPWREEARLTGKDPLVVKRLIARHGYEAHEILTNAQRNFELNQTLCECEQIMASEVEYCVRREWVTTLADLKRRTRWGDGACQGCRCVSTTARFMGKLLHWSEEEVREQERQFTDERANSYGILFGEQAKQEDYARQLLLMGGPNS